MRGFRQSVRSWKNGRGNRILAVAIDDRFIRAAVRTAEDGLQAVVYPLSDPSADSIARVLGDILKQTRPSRCLLALSRKETLVRRLRAPAEDAEEVRAMAALQAPLTSPYSAAETVHDVYVRSRRAGNTDLEVVLTRRSVLERYLELFRRSRAQLDQIAFAPLALAAWYRVQEGEMAAANAWIYVDMDHATVDLGVLADGSLMFSRSLFLPEERLNVPREIRRMMLACCREGVRIVPAGVLLSGALGRLQEMSTCLSDSLELPVRVCAFPGEVGRDDVSLSAVAGLLVSDAALDVDLVPQEERDRRRQALLQSRLLRTTALLVLLLGLLWGFGEKKLRDKQTYLDQLRTATAAIAPQVGVLRDRQQALEAFRQQQDPAASVLEVLGELTEIVPEGVFIDEFSFAVGSNVVLSGDAPSMAAVFQRLVPVLQQSDHFSSVAVNSAKKTGEGKVFFQIEAALIQAGD